MQDFKKLLVWKRAHELTLSIYTITKMFPSEATFGLKAQMRRASASIGINIAEGCGRSSQTELRRCLRVAQGSASELEYEVLLARDLGLIQESDFLSLSGHVVEIKRMTTALIRKLRTEN